MRIGIDVGGTNTDTALIDGGVLRASCKSPTTPDVSTGIIAGLRRTLAIADTSPGAITAVMIGTTHFTNAVVERRRLLEVAGVRLGLPGDPRGSADDRLARRSGRPARAAYLHGARRERI